MTQKIKREFSVESHPYPGLVIYEISRDDLDQIERETLTVNEDLVFASVLAPIAITLSVTIATVDIPAGKLYDIFWLVMIVGYLGALYFGYRWWTCRKQFQSAIRRIRERSGPLGEEGKELDSEQLAQLPASERNPS